MAILNIETSTTVCSVALSESGEAVFEKSSFEDQSHAALLGSFVEEAIKFANSDKLSVEAVAVSSGPGSYTGLRIGVSMAKGLCFGWNVPLISVSTLELMALTAIHKCSPDANTILCPMIDARRMEVYSALYDNGLRKIRDARADIVNSDTYAEFLNSRKILFFGNGATKCKSVIVASNVEFVDSVVPIASEMASLSETAYKEKRFEDVAYFEPFYLKDFVATIPKNKVLS